MRGDKRLPERGDREYRLHPDLTPERNALRSHQLQVVRERQGHVPDLAGWCRGCHNNGIARRVVECNFSVKSDRVRQLR